LWIFSNPYHCGCRTGQMGILSLPPIFSPAFSVAIFFGIHVAKQFSSVPLFLAPVPLAPPPPNFFSSSLVHFSPVRKIQITIFSPSRPFLDFSSSTSYSTVLPVFPVKVVTLLEHLTSILPVTPLDLGLLSLLHAMFILWTTGPIFRALNFCYSFMPF